MGDPWKKKQIPIGNHCFLGATLVLGSLFVNVKSNDGNTSFTINPPPGNRERFRPNFFWGDLRIFYLEKSISAFCPSFQKNIQWKKWGAHISWWTFLLASAFYISSKPNNAPYQSKLDAQLPPVSKVNGYPGPNTENFLLARLFGILSVVEKCELELGILQLVVFPL